MIDGSNAPPGFVGEYLSVTQNVNFAGNPADTNTTISMTTLQPGDWDVFISGWADSPVGGFQIATPTWLPGFSNWIGADWWFGGTVPTAGDSFAGPIGHARASLSQPTLIPLQVIIVQSVNVGLGAGTAQVLLEARRAR